jgi:hypothetical protein
MRMPKYLSPTSLALFYQDRSKFYITYLCETRTPRDPQTEPMAVGSAFDAKVKSFLVERLIGKRPEFEFDTIFNQQVEPQNRDAARAAGDEVFHHYCTLGAMADLLLDLEGCIGQPRFEASIEAPVTSQLVIGAVPFLGKPDIYFITKKGARVIFDWKVNGYYSAHNVSPKPGYIRQRTKDSKNGRSHDKAMVMDFNGVKISTMHPLCTVDKGWAAQLSIYAWLLGEAIGAQFITAIDQIAVGRDSLQNREFRIAQHRAVVTEKFQSDVFIKAHKAWHIIQSGHIFDQLTREESDRQCKMLDEMASMPPDPAFADLVR